jgi:hypothetical protein
MNKNIKLLRLLSLSFFISIFSVFFTCAMEGNPETLSLEAMLADQDRWCLHNAAIEQNPDKVAQLLGEGYKATEKNSSGFTPLYEAIASLQVNFSVSGTARSNMEVIGILVNAGADPLELCGRNNESVIDLIARLIEEQRLQIQMVQLRASLGRGSARVAERAKALISHLENVRNFLEKPLAEHSHGQASDGQASEER